MGDFEISESGILVWKKPDRHPLLKATNTDHPSLIRKAAEVYSSGRVQGLPKLCSENSEDACTWFYFSPLIEDTGRKAWVLARLLREAFPGQINSDVFRALPSADLHFWYGKETTSILRPPPSRSVPEGPTEVDLMITVGKQAVIFIEAKYHSKLSETTKYDRCRDQVIRNIDIGSWFAKGRFERFYLLVLQYGDHPINAEKIMSLYLHAPENIRRKLSYRDDLSGQEFETLSKSVAFVRWPDPLS